MNVSFGIDHPLLATHNIDDLRNRLISLGFNMTAIGKHPWGTNTSLAMFDGCLLEIMGVYDDTLLDQVPAGDFRFGRHIYEHLQVREGVALTALHSTNSTADAEQAASAGFRVAGHLEFGRDVTLPSGETGRTKTTLALLPDDTFPRLSFFLCQQHRPELIYVPQWLQHPNNVNGICGVTIVAKQSHHPALLAKFGGLYGPQNGLSFDTGNGPLRIMTADTFADLIGPLPEVMDNDTAPFIANMDFTMPDSPTMQRFLDNAKIGYRTIENGFALTDPTLTANTTLRFIAP